MPGGAFAAGDRALLVDAKRRRHLLTLEVGGELHLHTGVVRHDDLIGAPDGSTVRTTLGARLTAVSPTMADYVLEMPRGAQVIYPKDLGPILVLADVFPGAKVLESGVGSGALTIALLRAIGPTGHVTSAMTSPGAHSRTSKGSWAQSCRSTSRCAMPTTASTRKRSIASCSTCRSRGES